MSSYAEAITKLYAKQVTSIVARLHDLADDVERSGKAQKNRVGGYQDDLPEYLNSAERVVHDVMWAVANLNLDGLINTAGEADRATRNPEAQA